GAATGTFSRRRGCRSRRRSWPRSRMRARSWRVRVCTRRVPEAPSLCFAPLPRRPESPPKRGKRKRARQDSNLRPLAPEASALSAELRARVRRVYRSPVEAGRERRRIMADTDPDVFAMDLAVRIVSARVGAAAGRPNGAEGREAAAYLRVVLDEVRRGLGL